MIKNICPCLRKSLCQQKYKQVESSTFNIKKMIQQNENILTSQESEELTSTISQIFSVKFEVDIFHFVVRVLNFSFKAM